MNDKNLNDMALRVCMILLLSAFVCMMISGFAGCRSIKNLSKKIDKTLTKKDSTQHTSLDSFYVKKDNSKFNSEIVIEFDSGAFQKRLYDDGAAVDPGAVIQPAGVIVDPSGYAPIIQAKQPIKRITIKTNAQLNKSDSGSNHQAAAAQVKTTEKKKEVQATREVKRTTPIYYYFFIFAILAAVGYWAYRKYKTPIIRWVKKILS